MVVRAAFLLLLALSQTVASAEVTATVESNQVAVGAPFLLTLRASGAAVGEVKVPEEVKGIEITRQPVRQFTSFSQRPGGSSASVEYGFRVTATEAGRVTIPPFGVKIDGRMEFTKALEITVTPGAPRIAPPRGNRRPPEREEVQLEDAVFVTSEVDKAEVFEQEPIRLTLSLWQIDNDALDVEPYGRDIAPPTTEGFYATPRMPQYVADAEEDRDGRRYRVQRFQQTLYPARAGALSIGEWNWKGAVRFWSRSGTQYRDLTLQAEPVAVNVKPLPQPPADFRGAVGRYKVQGDVTEPRVAQGMPTKLVIRVIGEGNPDAIGAPALPEIPGAHVSDPERVDVPISDPQGISAEKDFVYTLTPTQAGTLHVPEIAYSFFDIGAGQYATQKVGPFEVEVVPSGESARRVVVDAATPPEATEGAGGNEMAPLETNPGKLAPEPSWGLVAALAGLTPPLAYGALALFMARRRRFQHDVRYARSYHARGRALRRLDSVSTSREPSDELFRALAGFVADKCAVTEAGMTSADVARLLEANGVDEELRDGYLKILRACERVRYGGSELKGAEQDALVHAAHAGVDALDAEWRRGGR